MKNIRTISIACLAYSAWPCAQAHGFGERYDLPVPMTWVILAALSVLLLTFLASIWLLDGAFSSDQQAPKTLHSPLDLSFKSKCLGGISLILLIFCTVCANFGSQDPLMNFAPTFIWIVWWLGTSFGVVLLGNFWPNINPWLWLDRFSHWNRTSHRPAFVWNDAWGVWPAVAGLLIWCALEVVYPIAAMPERLSWWIIAYSCINALGMNLFGTEAWCQHAECFSVYFSKLSGENPIHSRPTQRQPLRSHSYALSEIGLVMAMFASVLYDGLHASQIWPPLELMLKHWGIFSTDVNGYKLGFLGLLMVWLSFLMIYLLACKITQHWMTVANATSNDEQGLAFLELANHFSASFIPIAIAYLLAHNFSSFFIQGQSIVALISDPLGRQWNLFGSAQFESNVGLIDAKLTWYVATISIVVGHMVSIFKAHRLAQMLNETQQHKSSNLKPWQINLPLTILMLGFTALSLSIIAEPLANG